MVTMGCQGYYCISMVTMCSHGYCMLSWLPCCHGYYVFSQRKIKEFVRSMEEQVTNRQHLCLMYRRAKLHEEMTQIMISRGRLEELDTFTPVSSTHRMWEWHNVATPTLTKQTRRKKLNPIDQPVSHHSVDTSPSLLTKPQLHVSQETPPPLSIDHMINTGTQNVKVYVLYNYLIT